MSDKKIDIFDPEKYKWKGFNPRVKRWFFRWKPRSIRGANFREFQWLWWSISVSWWYYHGAIWSDGWDACFRQSLPEKEALESTKYKHRIN